MLFDGILERKLIPDSESFFIKAYLEKAEKTYRDKWEKFFKKILT